MTATAFWRWFEQHGERLRGLDTESLVNEVYDELAKVDGRLGLEVGGKPNPNGDREIIITAYAMRDAMPVALDLAARAPHVPGFTVIGLRPAKGFRFSFKNDKGGFEGKDLRFVARRDGESIRLQLQIPAPLADLPPGQREQLGWQIVNVGLGEQLAAAIDHLEVVEGYDGGESIDQLAEWLRSPAGPAMGRS